jgi:hypothetical protein
MNELPGMTDEERAALNSMDMTESLGTWEKRYGVAMRAAMRWFRERNDLEKQVFDMGGLNDAWALEVDQLQAKLAAAEARCVDLPEGYIGLTSEIATLHAKLAAAEALWNAAVDTEGSDWADDIAAVAKEMTGDEITT